METVFDASAVMVFGYFPSVDMDMLSTFRELAKNFPDALFVYSSEADIGEHLGLHSDTVVCFSSADSQHRISRNLSDYSALIDLVQLHTFPLIVQIEESLVDLVEFDGPVMVLVGNISSTVDPVMIRDSGILLAHVECSSANFAEVVRWLGKTECPCVWVLENPTNPAAAKYKLGDPLSANRILEFLEQFFSGERSSLIPFVKSELASPSDDPSEAALDIVGSTFSSSLIESPILVLFYAPWCAACIDLLDDYDALAKTIHQSQLGTSIRVGKIDMSRNDAPGWAPIEYPTVALFFSPTEQLLYEGGGNLQDVPGWITTQAANRAAVPKLTKHDEL